jgi:curli biogenesis system outer membrane secretion channel CsgG
MRNSSLLIGIFLLTTCAGAQTQAPVVDQNKSPATQPCPDLTVKPGHGQAVQLNAVKKIFVESFGDDPISKEMQSMIVSSLVNSKQFKVTENRDKADAILKGVALEKTAQEVHAYGEGTAVGSAAGGHSGSINGSLVNGSGSVSGSSSGGFVAHSLGINDSSLNTETIDQARIAVRLVNSDGDVIWTTTQESKGAKYKGAGADVADMCVKQLLRDVGKLEGVSPSQSGTVVQAKDGQSTKQ